MGLGRYGGGIGVTRYLAAKYPNAHLTITDLLSQAQLADSIQSIEDLITGNRITLHLGEHLTEDFTNADLIIANPAVPKPWKNKYLLAAQESNTPITTEIRLLTEALPRTVTTIGITGSAGKSTTASMIHHILKGQNITSHLGGNLGGSLLDTVHEIHEGAVIVLELSSAQLYWLGKSIGYADAIGWSPDVAVLTNITPNHLDWHETLEHYRNSKENIFRYQGRSDTAIRSEEIDYRLYDNVLAFMQLKVPGEHNQRNAILAALVCKRILDIDIPVSIRELQSFAGLPHRLQLVLETDEPSRLRFYNDSKATTPEATLLAVGSFDNPSKIHLIAGGYDKKIELSKISQLAPTLAGLYTIGATGSGIAEKAPAESARYCETLENAVKYSISAMQPGDLLLLSPACASWDQFVNFEERGRVFEQLVRRLVNTKNGNHTPEI